MPLIETVTDLELQADVIRRRRYGVIEIVDGRLVRVVMRPFAKFVGLHESLLGGWYHRRARGDRCWLYFNQPWRHANYLALKYGLSARDTTLRSIRESLSVLDEIARIKRSDAILCDAANLRISDRLLTRWGWQAHKPSRWHRHFIKRFYGVYPSEPQAAPNATASTCAAPTNWQSSQDADLRVCTPQIAAQSTYLR